MSETSTYDFDVIVIGGGPGGYVAAIRAAQLGARTALAERDRLGGTCLNKGCIPTKSLLNSAEKFYETKKNAGDYGIDAGLLKADLANFVVKKNQAVDRLVSGVTYLMKKNNIKVFKGTAAFVDEHTIRVGEDRITSDKIIIATGSQVRDITLPGDMSLCVSSNEILNTEKIPENFVVIGGGVVGIELASVFHCLGSKVTVLEVMDDILLPFDRELVAILKEKLRRDGITVITSATVKEIRTAEGKSRVVIESGGKEQAPAADLILLAAGRKPCLDGLQPEKAGLRFSEKGIPADPDTMQTNVKNIFAIGDVAGGIQLAHFASAQGIAAAEQALGVKSHVNLKVVPSCVYTVPELSSAGMTEEATKAKNLPYKVARFPMRGNGKSVVAGETDGLVKLIYNEESGEIFGIHILAERAADIIGEAALALNMELTAAEIAATIHPHPTVCEAVMEAAHIASGSPIHQ
ncbi:MAG TPA: dihydrolipoyl dehydrogenase [Anaerovoracaceae bacterium]|nr:dihydrolipoyl dehydrogenase [Anaerovoracaceae bacterium]